MHLTFAFSCRFGGSRNSAKSTETFFFLSLFCSHHHPSAFTFTLAHYYSLTVSFSSVIDSVSWVHSNRICALLFCAFFAHFLFLSLFLHSWRLSGLPSLHHSLLHSFIFTHSLTHCQHLHGRKHLRLTLLLADSVQPTWQPESCVWAVAVAGQNRIELKQKSRLPFCVNKKFFSGIKRVPPAAATIASLTKLEHLSYLKKLPSVASVTCYLNLRSQWCLLVRPSFRRRRFFRRTTSTPTSTFTPHKWAVVVGFQDRLEMVQRVTPLLDRSAVKQSLDTIIIMVIIIIISSSYLTSITFLNWEHFVEHWVRKRSAGVRVWEWER